MRNALLIGIAIILALGTMLQGQGTSHLVYGTLHNAGGTTPDSLCVSFNAIVEGRPSDMITNRTPGCGYSGGYWGINTSAFEPDPSNGARIFISFIDTCRKQEGADTITIDYLIPSQDAELTTLRAQANIKEILPDDFEVNIYPNPFNSELHISGNFKKGDKISLTVYDVLGRELNNLYSGIAQNKMDIIWNGTDYNNESLPSGLYFLNINVNGNTFTKRVLYVK